MVYREVPKEGCLIVKKLLEDFYETSYANGEK